MSPGRSAASRSDRMRRIRGAKSAGIRRPSPRSKNAAQALVLDDYANIVTWNMPCYNLSEQGDSAGPMRANRSAVNHPTRSVPEGESQSEGFFAAASDALPTKPRRTHRAADPIGPTSQRTRARTPGTETSLNSSPSLPRLVEALVVG